MPTPPGDEQPKAARGPCSRCNELNLYTNLTCDLCGTRLDWADTFAATSGEKCPACEHFNPYLNSACSSCGKRLPWADAAAPSRLASGQAESEQKSLILTFVLCALAFVIFMGFIFSSLAPTR